MTGNTFLSSRRKTSETKEDSLADIQKRFPLMVLISPLWASILNGWARSHDGKVFGAEPASAPAPRRSPCVDPVIKIVVTQLRPASACPCTQWFCSIMKDIEKMFFPSEHEFLIVFSMTLRTIYSPFPFPGFLFPAGLNRHKNLFHRGFGGPGNFPHPHRIVAPRNHFFSPSFLG